MDLGIPAIFAASPSVTSLARSGALFVVLRGFTLVFGILDFFSKNSGFGIDIVDGMAKMSISRASESRDTNTKGKQMTTATIYLCGNDELLCDGLIQNSEMYADYISFAAVAKMIDDSGIAEAETESIFRDWQGGKFYSAGSVINGKKFGYKARYACTLAVNPSKELIALVERADVMIREELASVAAMEDE